jgi:hypothetical protein
MFSSDGFRIVLEWLFSGIEEWKVLLEGRKEGRDGDGFVILKNPSCCSGG